MLSNEYMNDYMKKRYKKRREEAVKYLGGVCVGCEKTTNLDFHHVDPKTKLFTIASGSSFSDARFWAEVDKCELLCRDCHTNNHRSSYPCGTPQRYWRGCRCELCRVANNKHHAEWKRNRST